MRANEHVNDAAAENGIEPPAVVKEPDGDETVPVFDPPDPDSPEAAPTPEMIVMTLEGIVGAAVEGSWLPLDAIEPAVLCEVADSAFDEQAPSDRTPVFCVASEGPVEDEAGEAGELESGDVCDGDACENVPLKIEEEFDAVLEPEDAEDTDLWEEGIDAAVVSEDAEDNIGPVIVSEHVKVESNPGADVPLDTEGGTDPEVVLEDVDEETDLELDEEESEEGLDLGIEVEIDEVLVPVAEDETDPDVFPEDVDEEADPELDVEEGTTEVLVPEMEEESDPEIIPEYLDEETDPELGVEEETGEVLVPFAEGEADTEVVTEVWPVTDAMIVAEREDETGVVLVAQYGS
ncbi:hypothetical protein N7523_001093 [Penicillium sp. IBT 18751x]|nr:hypothetical protein N7523_001093 [Penicillium sp. IBT 18751x]